MKTMNREQQIKRLAEKYKMIVSSDPSKIQRFLHRDSDAETCVSAGSNIDLGKYEQNKYYRLLERCSQDSYEANIQLIQKTYSTLSRLAKHQAIFVNIMPSVFVKDKVAYTLTNDTTKGFLKVLQFQLSSAKDLQAILNEAMLNFKGEPSESARTRLCLLELSASPTREKEYPGTELLADDVIRFYKKSEILIQPSIKPFKLIRGFYIPPKAKLFHYQIANVLGVEEVKCVALLKEGRFPVLEEQCKHLFNVLQNSLFHPRNLKLEGISFDFVKVGPVTCLTKVNSFKTSILDPNCMFVEEKRVLAKKCYGVFCKSKDSFEMLVQLIKSVRKCEGYKGEYTLLYKDIADFDKLLEGVNLPDLLKPFLQDSIQARSGSTDSLLKVGERVNYGNEPASFQSMPVCETCYYMYLLYKSKQEKAKLNSVIMKKTIEHLRNKDIIEWSMGDYENFVLACDLKSNPKAPESLYAVATKTAAEPRNYVRRKKPSADPYFPFKDTNLRATVTELAAALESLKRTIGGANAPTKTYYQERLPKIRVNFVKENIKKAVEKPKKNSAETERVWRAERDSNAPQINDYRKVKHLYDTVLSQMKQRYHHI